MGRHSRRGPAPKGDAADTTGTAENGPGRPGTGHGAPPGGAPVPGPGTGRRRLPGPATGEQRPPMGEPPSAGGSRGQAGARYPEGTPAHGVRSPLEGTAAHGMPPVTGGAPARGVPPSGDRTPARAVPRVRGGHPEQPEGGGAWGELGGPGGRAGGTYGAPPGPGPLAAPGPPAEPDAPAGRRAPAGPGPGVTFPRQQQRRGQRHAGPAGPRQAYLDAFDAADGDARPHRRPGPPSQAADPHPLAAGRDSARGAGAPGAARGADDGPPTGTPVAAKGGKGGRGRTFTGIAAAAVTAVLAVVVAGQAADGRGGQDGRARSAGDQVRDARASASRADGRPTPSTSAEAAPLTYEQKMGKKYPLSATLEGPGTFDAVPGVDKAPGRGQKFTYRVDVEKGLGLDAGLFARAVHKTLNDDRSWAHNGARTFERIHSGQPDFVITLASPGTTADWCAKSGLDTTVDNVSCDSAATERVMINAYRWAQGSETYGDEIHAYRQMLINHEVGHRLGHSHVTCDKDGELAPVMQQQTKFLDPAEGIHCLPNAWPYPGS
ncbi:DUF3152 domain-containing protein [Streptomyces sp. NPDC052020]|uniref:DUF3152 domain-containing protein n=1 Tax=Streptomyces sp. NPDC052020 TaxID=3155677 RepID=UPI00341FC8CC